jgi:hypothetical protein
MCRGPVEQVSCLETTRPVNPALSARSGEFEFASSESQPQRRQTSPNLARVRLECEGAARGRSTTVLAPLPLVD